MMSDQSSRKKLKRYHLRSTRTTLLQLNDYCLFEIFDCLRPKDFLDIANVCQRLRTLAQDHFSLKCKNYVLSNSATYRNQRRSGSCITARNLFSNFGGCIREINLSHPLWQWPGSIPKKLKLPLITKYCPNITNVTIYGLAINSKDTEMLKSFFANISKLTIEEWQLVDVTLFYVLSLCPKLKYLKVSKEVNNEFKEVSPDKLMDTEATPTNLEEIILNSDDLLSHQQLTRLIESNINLRKLHMRNIRNGINLKINVEEIKRLMGCREFVVEYVLPRMPAPSFGFVIYHVELDDDDHGTTDELDCGLLDKPMSLLYSK